MAALKGETEGRRSLHTMRNGSPWDAVGRWPVGRGHLCFFVHVAGAGGGVRNTLGMKTNGAISLAATTEKEDGGRGRRRGRHGRHGRAVAIAFSSTVDTRAVVRSLLRARQCRDQQSNCGLEVEMETNLVAGSAINMLPVPPGRQAGRQAAREGDGRRVGRYLLLAKW